MFVQETFYKIYYIFKVTTTLQQLYKIILSNRYQSEPPYVSNFVKLTTLTLNKPLTRVLL